MTSEALDHQLPWHKRLALRFHLSICKYCNRYADQLQFLHQVVDFGKVELEETGEPGEVKMCDAAKDRLREVLQQDS